MQYKENYDKNVLKYNTLENIKKNISYIKDNSTYVKGEHPNLKDEIEKFNNLKLNFESESEIREYSIKFAQIKEEISLKIKEEKKRKLEREKERRREREKERERNESYNSYANYNNYSNSSYAGSSSNNDDGKKVYLKLCQDCKNNCVGCGSKRKIDAGGAGVSKGFGQHKKCQNNSCYICGKSNSSVCERDSTHLCKACYHSNKFDISKCLDCHKSFK